jgi:hypothetical protein
MQTSTEIRVAFMFGGGAGFGVGALRLELRMVRRRSKQGCFVDPNSVSIYSILRFDSLAELELKGRDLVSSGKVLEIFYGSRACHSEWDSFREGGFGDSPFSFVL